MKFNYKLLYLVILLLPSMTLLAQEQRTITGTVTDVTGMPLPGANVLVKGTTRGEQTDFDGKYAIDAIPGETLVYSYLGMETVEYTVSNNTIIDVVLKPASAQLDEVVITALGIRREEKALGYSVQNVAGEGLTEARESNLINALSGKAAGVQVTSSSGSVGSSSRIVLRGNSSITGNNQPLFIVDGVPIDNTSYSSAGSSGGRDLPNGVASINPDDIESIAVLKGPNAAALYGLRAGNGVIVITTKSGVAGRVSVSVNNNITFSNPLILPDYQNSYGQGGTPGYFEFVDGASGGVNDGVDESWGPALDVGLEFIQWNSQLINSGLPLPWISYPNNVRDFFDTGLTVSNNLSISSGTEVSSMRLSLGRQAQEGMVPNTDFTSYTLSFNGSMDLWEDFHAGLAMSYNKDFSNNLPTVGYTNENIMQQFIWSARQVNFSDLRDWRNLPLAPEGTAAAGTPFNWNHNFQNNPYWVLETNLNGYKRDRLIGNVNIGYDFTDWFSVTSKLGMDHYSQHETFQKGIGTNEFPQGYYAEIMRRYTEINAEILLSVNRDITEDITFSINVGGNQMRRKYNSLSATAPQLELPNFYNLSNIRTGVTPLFGNTLQEQRINSIYGFGQLAFRDYLFIDFTGRKDWSSLLPVDSNSFFYPSVSGSAVISDMFEISESGIDYFKIRGSWSQVGSTGALDPYNLSQTFGLTNTGYGNQAFTPATLFNPELKSETVIGIEGGIDLRAFSNRLRLSATYYNERSEDLLVPIQVSASTGVTNIWDNIAEMSNEGVEVQLGGTLVQSEDFSFDVDLNWAMNNNEVTSLGGLDTYILGGHWGVTIEARPGQPYGVLVGRGFARSPEGEVIYENGLPVIEETPKILGDIAPDWTGGATFTINYKNFTLNTLFDAKIGGDVHSMSYSWGRYAGTFAETLIGRETGIVGGGVKRDGNGGFVPNDVVVGAKVFNQTSYGNGVEESAIFDASYIKWRGLTVGYSIPFKYLENTGLTDLKISAVGRNLAILYKNAPHIDPETGFSSSNGEQGQEFGQLPSARTVGLNVNLKF